MSMVLRKVLANGNSRRATTHTSIQFSSPMLSSLNNLASAMIQINSPLKPL